MSELPADAPRPAKPLEPDQREALVHRVLAQPWTRSVVDEVHLQALSLLSMRGFEPRSSEPPTVRTHELVSVRSVATEMATPGSESRYALRVQTTLVASRIAETFGAFDIRWNVARNSNLAQVVSTLVAVAGPLGQQFGTLDPFAVLMGHLQRAYARDWLGQEERRRLLLRERLEMRLFAKPQDAAA